MNILELKSYEKGLFIENAKDFIPKHIFDCGQCFRWNELDDKSYVGVVNSKVLKVYAKGNDVFIEGANENDKSFLEDYFDLSKDYTEIKKHISQEDSVLEEAIKCGEGIRVLNQEPFETTISFIISARNSIPVIKKTVEKLSKEYGDKILFNGEEYYSFPTPSKLSKATEEDLRKLGCSFRSPYIVETTKDILNGKIDLEKLKNLSTSEALNELIKLKGVGIKVADCIMLFSLKKEDAFPVDVWIQRIMEHFYLADKTSLKKMREYAREKFKNYSGIAQQYLFYYARDFKGKEGFEKK